jgi:hypothetical protein
VTDFTSKRVGPPAELAVHDDPSADADTGLQANKILDSASKAEPSLGERLNPALVVYVDGDSELIAEELGDR